MRLPPLRCWSIAACLAAALLAPSGSGLAEEVGNASTTAGEPAAQAGNAVDEAPSEEPKKKDKKKSRKEEREERLKYSVQPRAAKAFEKAREHMEAQRYPEAREALGKLKLDKLSPHERAQANRYYGYIAYGQEQNEAAIEYLQKALAEEEAMPPRDRADTLFQVAQIQGALSRWKDVIATLDAWFKIVERPNSVAYFLMALSYFQLEDLDGALLPAKKAVEIAKVPQQAWLQLLLAIYLTKEDYASAKPVLDQMIALYPNSGKDYWMQLSALHGVTGDDPRALGVLELAYRKGLLSEDRDVRRMLQMMLARGIPFRAARIFEQEMEKKRFLEDTEALELLSIAWILAREPEKATAPLAHAAELSEKGELYVHLAQIHLLQEEWQDAVAVLRKALAKGGLADPGTAQLMLGIAYYNAQELQQAHEWFARAQLSKATREQAEIWLAHVDREIEAKRSALGGAGGG